MKQLFQCQLDFIKQFREIEVPAEDKVVKILTEKMKSETPDGIEPIPLSVVSIASKVEYRYLTISPDGGVAKKGEWATSTHITWGLLLIHLDNELSEYRNRYFNTLEEAVKCLQTKVIKKL
jgi:hypothetical protein